MKENKWKITVVTIASSVLMVLNIVKPEIFDIENNQILIGSINGILTSIIAGIAVFKKKAVTE